MSVPRIRVDGFNKNFEKKIFGEIVRSESTRMYIKSVVSDLGKYEVIQQGDIPILGYSDDRPFEKYKSVILFGDHTLSLYRPKAPFLLATDGIKILQSTILKRDYLYYLTQNYIPKSQGYKRHFSVLKQVFVNYSRDSSEQSAIGSLFRTLDDLLASYKDNLANYQSLKATMLSKMFPKAGQTVPEIRLDGYEGEWEVVSLGTLIENYDEIISGVSGFPIATSSRKGLYLQNDYFEGGRTGIDLTLDFHRVPMGYVTYRHMSDDSIFKFNKNNFETDVLVSKEYPVFISNDSSDIDFLLYHLNNSRLFLRFSTMQKLGGTRVRLYYKNLITYKLAVPTLKEQQAIGSYFSNLDNLIITYQEKISQLETLKKKLLQDMFI